VLKIADADGDGAVEAQSELRWGAWSVIPNPNNQWVRGSLSVIKNPKRG